MKDSSKKNFALRLITKIFMISRRPAYFLCRSRRRLFFLLCFAIFALRFFLTDDMSIVLLTLKNNLNKYKLISK